MQALLSSDINVNLECMGTLQCASSSHDILGGQTLLSSVGSLEVAADPYNMGHDCSVQSGQMLCHRHV